MDRNVYGKKGIQSELEQKRCQIKHLPFDSNSERGISANPIWRSEETSGRLIRWRLARHRVTSVDQIRSGAGHGRLELFCFYGDGPARGKRGRFVFFSAFFFSFQANVNNKQPRAFQMSFPVTTCRALSRDVSEERTSRMNKGPPHGRKCCVQGHCATKRPHSSWGEEVNAVDLRHIRGRYTLRGQPRAHDTRPPQH